MILNTLQDLLPYCRQSIPKKRMAVIKAEDSHTLSAVLKAKELDVIEPILIGNRQLIENVLSVMGQQSRDFEIVEAADAREATLKAIALVHEQKADFLMKGLVETKELMKIIVDRTSDMRTGRLMSKIDFVENPGYHKLFALSDSALNTKPDVNAKKQIIENSLEVLKSMGIKQPKVAVLAASETLNPKLSESADAYALKQMYENGEFSDCILEGPISIDLALDPESVKIKNYQSPVGGDADLLICPDLVSGNLMGKGMLLTGAKAAGIIVGAKVPIVLMSRAAAVEEKFQSVILGAIASQKA